jgi:predicted acetyltransferase
MSWRAGQFRAMMSSMEVALLAAGIEQRSTFSRLMQLYAYDFSEVTRDDVGEDGLFRVPSIDRYWQEPWWRPFLLRVGSACAGFVIVGSRSRLVEGLDRWDMAEFFVLQRYRRAGVGTRAANLAFDAFRGPWEVRQMARATAATAFWRSAIHRYTSGRFREVAWDDARWRGPVQMFDSPA